MKALSCRGVFSFGIFSFAGIFIPAASVNGMELRSDLELEARIHVQTPEHAGQFDHHYAVGFEAGLQQDFNNGDTLFTFVPYARWDSEDEQRRHFDIRELNVVHVSGNWETLVGISRIFWGVTESNHLVNIINQTDSLEGIDGEDKLGQPMFRLGHSFDQSTLAAFVLPGFREREFLSADNPIALPFEVSGNPVYQSDREDNNIDYAVRYSGYRGLVDYGVFWFRGTSRAPDFVADSSGQLVAFYPQIDQFGIDIQITSDAWLWKLEAIKRTFDSDNPLPADDFTAYAGGFEYSFYGIADGLFDLGLLAEYHHDSRGDRQAVAFQNDLFLGLRFVFNDAQGSEMLMGGFVDRDDDTASFRVEANRRIFTDSRISLEVQGFSNVAPGNIGFNLRDSDFVLLSLEFYF